MEKKAKMLVPQGIPTLWYKGPTTSGNAPAKQLRRKAVCVLDWVLLSSEIIKLTIRCHSTRCIFLKRINEIIQRSLKDGEESDTGHGETDNWSNPGVSVKFGQPLFVVPVQGSCNLLWICGPAGREHSSGEQDGTEGHRGQAGLGNHALA